MYFKNIINRNAHILIISINLNKITLKATRALKVLTFTRKILINQDVFLEFNIIKSLYFIELNDIKFFLVVILNCFKTIILLIIIN